MFKMKCKQYKYTIAFFAILFCYYQYCIRRAYGFTFFPDEFGYWTYAAKAAGYDWSEITALGSYYSYGYSLILFPIFLLCKNAVMAYRIAVTMNFILLGMTYFVLLALGKRLLLLKDGNIQTDEHLLQISTTIAVFYPSWLFYARSTMVEVLLMTIFVVICFLMYHYLENNRLVSLILLVISLVYIHFLHMRAIGVLAAGAVTLLCSFFLHRKDGEKEKKKNHILLFLCLGIAALALGFFIKNKIEATLYAGTGEATFAINDYAGQLDKVRYLFTKDGLENLICGLAGKLLYMGCATFGLAFWGIAYTIRKVCNKTEKKEKRLFSLFVLLASFAELAINTIYNIYPIRVDSVTYGRYHEFVFPVLMILGLYEMKQTKKKNLLTGTVVILAAQIPLMMLTLQSIQKYQLTNFHGYVMVGMSYFYNSENINIEGLYWITFAVCAAVTLLLTLIMIVIQRDSKSFQFVLVVMIGIEIILSMKASTLYIEPSARGAFRDTFVVEKIEQLKQEDTDRNIVFIAEQEDTLVSILQFMMREQEIHVLPVREEVEAYAEEELSQDDIVILDYRSEYGTEIEKKYQQRFSNGHFIVYYNEKRNE